MNPTPDGHRERTAAVYSPVMGPGSNATLSFPDGPKLELDAAIDTLVDRAEGVRRAQGRLRALVQAIELVNDELSPDAVLRHVVEAACALSGARHGALGVLVDGVAGLGDFVYGGTDPRATGPPAGHPPSSILEVPIRVRGEAFGTLYLTEGAHGPFSAEDEQLVRSLTLAAGAAIANARLYDDSRRRQSWLAASADISARVLAQTGEDPLTTIVRSARQIVDADLVSISLVTPDGADLLVEVVAGDDDRAGRRTPLAGSPSGGVLRDRTPLVTRDTVIVALPSTNGVLGVIELVRDGGRRSFSPADVTLADGFAGHASVALEFARARADQQRVALYEDRDRIARDLHDHVIQQLFAIGLSLEGLALVVAPDHDAPQVLHDRVDDLDRTIRRIRTSIFELRGPLVGTRAGLRADVLGVAADLAAALGFAPDVTFAGQVDLLVREPVAGDVVACVRETLTNVVKHARATRVDVELRVVGTAGNSVRLTVSDDGRGIPADARRSGLDNLRTRAEQRGGTFELRPPPGTGGAPGTAIVWTVPLS